jgi:ABC-2 type transport system permease protein
MTLNKYFSVAKVSVVNSLMYFTDFLAGSLFVGLIIFIFINLWQVVYSSSEPLIAGFTLPMMIWYLVMTESIVTSPKRIIEEIGDEIQSGDIAQNLNKPYNYVLFKYASTMGKTTLTFFMTFLVGGIVTYLMVGGIDFSLKSLPFIILLVVVALTLNFAMMAFLGIMALWLEDAKAIHFIYTKLVFVLGGMLIPLDIFPVWLQGISKALPFSFIAYHPARLFVNFSFTGFLEVFFYQLIWLGLIAIMISVVYAICIRRFSANGG